MDKKEKDLLHIITKNGERKTIPFPDNKDNHINEADNEEYKIDIDWYLNNGYLTIDQHKKNLKNKYSLDMSWYNEENGYITSKQLINKLQNNSLNNYGE